MKDAHEEDAASEKKVPKLEKKQKPPKRKNIAAIYSLVSSIAGKKGR